MSASSRRPLPGGRQAGAGGSRRRQQTPLPTPPPTRLPANANLETHLDVRQRDALGRHRRKHLRLRAAHAQVALRLLGQAVPRVVDVLQQRWGVARQQQQQHTLESARRRSGHALHPHAAAAPAAPTAGACRGPYPCSNARSVQAGARRTCMVIMSADSRLLSRPTSAIWSTPWAAANSPLSASVPASTARSSAASSSGLAMVARSGWGAAPLGWGPPGLCVHDGGGCKGGGRGRRRAGRRPSCRACGFASRQCRSPVVRTRCWGGNGHAQL